MKIALLYISTGKYFIFWEEFYKSAKQYLFADREREIKFFVFTDQLRELGEDVHVTVVEDEPWPFPTLKRYHYFLQLKSQLEDFDYIYFFNGNTKFLRPVGDEILPKAGTDFAFVQQPFTLVQQNTKFGYERRKESKAFIPIGEGEYYIWGAFNGGKPQSFLQMGETIKQWTNEDLKIPLITAFWDESYINRFLLDLERDRFTLADIRLFLVDGYNDQAQGPNNQVVLPAIHIMEKSRFFDTSFKQKQSLTFTQRLRRKIKHIMGI